MKTVVFKIGGSVESEHDYIECLRQLANDHIDRRCIFLFGGGAKVEQLRKLSAQQGWSQEKSHWAAIDAMDEIARFNSVRLGWPILKSPHEPMPAKCIFECKGWLSARQSDGCSLLPQSWDVTSDSIALLLADTLGADHLTLIKAVAPPKHRTFNHLSASGYLDKHFSVLQQSLGGRLVIDFVGIDTLRS